jgi:hypothetical protein
MNKGFTAFFSAVRQTRARPWRRNSPLFCRIFDLAAPERPRCFEALAGKRLVLSPRSG